MDILLCVHFADILALYQKTLHLFIIISIPQILQELR